MSDMEFEDILGHLSVAHDAPLARAGISRRRFLQAVAVGAGGVALAPWLRQLEAFAAPALGADDGILVVVQMGGGNDGVNTLVPIGDSAYPTLRSGIAYSASQLHMIAPGLGLNPVLPRLKAHYDAGNVAIVTGVGYHPPNLSHFESTATWMAGTATGGPTTGWLGRYLDGLPNAPSESLYAVSIGSSVPLHVVGATTRAAGLPLQIDGAFGIDRTEPSEARLCQAIGRFGVEPTGLGPWADAFGRSATQTLDLATRIKPAYAGPRPSSSIGSQLALAAHLINAQLGIRVLNVSLGSFDTHAGQRYQQELLLGQLDAAIDNFFATLAPAQAARTVVMTFSEFGRTPKANNNGGTDHGSSSVMFLCGPRVRGGLHGQQPVLSERDQWDNLRTHVDFRSVYQSVLGSALRADARQILGANYPGLDLVGPVAAVAAPPPPTAPLPPAPPPPRPGSSAAAKLSSKRAWLGGRRKVGQPRG